MNAQAYYDGFVSKCMEHGLSKRAADGLYKQAGMLDDLKNRAGAVYRGLSPDQRAALAGSLIGGGTGLVAGGLSGADFSNLLALTAGGAAVGGIGGYGGAKARRWLAGRRGAAGDIAGQPAPRV